MLRACIIGFKGNCYNHLPLVEFNYNNSFPSSISMVPYESLYGKRCKSPIGLFEVGEPSLLGPDMIYKTLDKVHIIRNQLQMTFSRQKSYAYHRRRDSEFEDSDKVYLEISPTKGWLDLARKGS